MLQKKKKIIFSYIFRYYRIMYKNSSFLTSHRIESLKHLYELAIEFAKYTIIEEVAPIYIYARL